MNSKTEQICHCLMVAKVGDIIHFTTKNSDFSKLLKLEVARFSDCYDYSDVIKSGHYPEVIREDIGYIGLRWVVSPLDCKVLRIVKKKP